MGSLTLPRLATAGLLTTAFLVACAAVQEQPVCAATHEAQATRAPQRPPANTNANTPQLPTTGRQQQPANRVTPPPAKPYSNPTDRPLVQQTSPAQPKLTYRTGRDDKQYRQYPGYAGWYPVSVWPIGYGDAYGCTVPGQESDGIDDIFNGD
ncbi:hypothetical protein [Nonomuraea dietziae]|uniref:hypothetical protein n=1 Tax=Nonomuraea dietziae TaxID=65515 RepID=UPI0033C1F12E